MKKLILTTAFFSAFTLAGLAQNNLNTNTTTDATPKKAGKDLTPEQAAQRQSTRAADELGLSAEQKQKFYDASLVRITANRPLKQQAEAATDKGSKKSVHQQMKANRDTFENNVNAMLTPEQKTKWEAQKTKAKANKESEDHLD